MKNLILFICLFVTVGIARAAEGNPPNYVELNNDASVELTAAKSWDIGYMTNNFNYSGKINTSYYFNVPIINSSIYNLQYEWRVNPSDGVTIRPYYNEATVTFTKPGGYNVYVRVTTPGNSNEFESASNNVSISY